MIGKKITINYAESESTTKIVTGKFMGFVPICSMVCIDCGKIWKLIPIESIIVIDILEPDKQKGFHMANDVMVM